MSSGFSSKSWEKNNSMAYIPVTFMRALLKYEWTLLCVSENTILLLLADSIAVVVTFQIRQSAMLNYNEHASGCGFPE